MTCIIPYGIDSSLDLGLATSDLLGVCDMPRGEPLADPAAALAAALASPLGFPPLNKAIVPGDRIVVALDSSAPQAGTLLAALVEYLLEAGAEPANLTVLRTQADCGADGEDPRDYLPSGCREQVALEIHDPAAKAQLGLLGSSHDGRPIYLNRTLLDADLAVPLGCLRAGDTLGYHGRHGGLFPAFADQKTLERYRKPRSGDARHEVEQRHRQEIDEIGWLLGTQFTVQVLPGAGDSLLAVLAGDPSEVFEQGERMFAEAWNFHLSRKASLVVAAVSGRAGLQTWDNLARALANAGRAVAEGGAIALCTELDAAPGQAVAALSQTDDWQAVLRRIRRDCPADALVAAEFIEICGRARVYLLSRLEESAVEELGLAPVANVADLKRLAGRHKSCIVLANAQHVRVTTDDD
jgi:nickel-dependent lactate racemase